MSLGRTDEKSSETSGKYEVQEIECSRSIDIEESNGTPLRPSPAEEAKLYRKIDLRIMPILVVMYTCSFLDRGRRFRPVIRYVFADDHS